MSRKTGSGPSYFVPSNRATRCTDADLESTPAALETIDVSRPYWLLGLQVRDGGDLIRVVLQVLQVIRLDAEM